MHPLPTPNSEALERSQALLQYILATIRANHHKISFAQYMNLALYTPNVGYYAGPEPKFGYKGDFITAPLLCSFFSLCLARQCQEIFQLLPGGDILEIGAGSGQMAADILTELNKNNSLPDHYYILELSAELKQRQQEKLTTLCPELLPRVQWLSSLPEHQSFQGVILGNEVLDAMPVHRFQTTKLGIEEIQVTEDKGTLKYTCSLTEKPELQELYHSRHWPIPYCSEINLNLKPWISSLSDILKAGVILLIDYGFPKNEYYHPDRNTGTLMCHYHHYCHNDPFFYPGLQDITAHVNFTDIAEISHKMNLDLLGFTTQAAFLLDCGLLEFAEHNLLTKSEQEKAKATHAIHILTAPSEMGELYKVIALAREIEGPLLGFNLIDRRYTL